MTAFNHFFLTNFLSHCHWKHWFCVCAFMNYYKLCMVIISLWPYTVLNSLNRFQDFFLSTWWDVVIRSFLIPGSQCRGNASSAGTQKINFWTYTFTTLYKCTDNFILIEALCDLGISSKSPFYLIFNSIKKTL